jgi:hypothetical protein
MRAIIGDCRPARLLGLSFALGACLAASLSACKGEYLSGIEEGVPDEALRSGIQRISGMRILFGHQSVGGNILTGFSEIYRELGLGSPAIAEAKAGDAFGDAALYHFYAGINEDPASKIRDFEAALRSGAADRMDLAFLKFCYVDVTASTDVAALFASYKAAVSAIRRDYPRLGLLHFTVPLQVDEGGIKGFAKGLLNKTRVGYGDNLAREAYNALLRSEYSGKEPVFDLALLESQSAESKPLVKSLKGRAYYAMRPEYSDDGGHLNAAGRRRAASHLIVALAALAPGPLPTASK